MTNSDQTTTTAGEHSAAQPTTTTTGQEYQGWPNYETWSVYTWLTGEQGAYNACRDMARHARDHFYLSGYMQGYWTEGLDDITEPIPFGGLLTHAVSRVDWDRIARSFFDAEHQPADDPADEE